jgi:hypothetical protein
MSYTIFTSNPAALIPQAGRAVNTFPSGLVRVDQSYLGLTSEAATHRAILAVGNEMPDGDSSPCIDGLYIFPEAQERRREDGFTEYIVSAYGRSNSTGVNSSAPWGKIYKFLYIGPHWQKFGNLVGANSGLMFEAKFIFANLNLKQVLPKNNLEDILGLENPADFSIAPKVLGNPLPNETGLFPGTDYPVVPEVAEIHFIFSESRVAPFRWVSFKYECKITFSNTMLYGGAAGNNLDGSLNIYAGVPYSIGFVTFYVGLGDPNFEPVSYGDFYEFNYTREMSPGIVDVSAGILKR